MHRPNDHLDDDVLWGWAFWIAIGWSLGVIVLGLGSAGVLLLWGWGYLG